MAEPMMDPWHGHVPPLLFPGLDVGSLEPRVPKFGHNKWAKESYQTVTVQKIPWAVLYLQSIITSRSQPAAFGDPSRKSGAGLLLTELSMGEAVLRPWARDQATASCCLGC